MTTPWDWHIEMAKAAMKSGEHVGAECPIALELGQLWELVALSEQTRKHCMQLENCAYGQNEMRVLRTGGSSATCCTARAPISTTCAG